MTLAASPVSKGPTVYKRRAGYSFSSVLVLKFKLIRLYLVFPPRLRSMFNISVEGPDLGQLESILHHVRTFGSVFNHAATF